MKNIRPYRVGTVSCGPSTQVHLARETPTANSPASALCGASCSLSAAPLRFLDAGCDTCRHQALAAGIAVVGDSRAGVSLHRYATAS